MEKQEMYRRGGNPDQWYRVRKTQLLEGRAKGAAIIEAATAGGLEVDILADSGLDLGQARYRGVNMSFLSKNGLDSAAVFAAADGEFLHTFPGGLLCTCGLRSAGQGNRDVDGEWHPMHGRYHGLQAAEVCSGIDGDAIVVSGMVCESALFGPRLILRRKIRMPVWGSAIFIEDTLENASPRPEEIMVLYHCNFGAPLLSEEARLVLPEARKTTPRTPWAAAGLDRALVFDRPADGEEERVFFHEMADCRARLENPRLGVAVTLRWSGDTLPVLAEWRSMASGDYALGLEPGNNFIKGRAAERENGTLRQLAAFETVTFRVSFEFEAL